MANEKSLEFLSVEQPHKSLEGRGQAELSHTQVSIVNEIRSESRVGIEMTCIA